MTKKKKTIYVTIMVILLILLTGGMYLFSIYHATQMGNLDLSKLHLREGLSEDVINLAVFGVDGRDDPEVDGDRSDVIMIATLDTKEKRIKLTSIMRDTFVKISEPDGTESYQKINAAYQIGGEAQTIRTINENFDMNISEYATVDFNAVMNVVDAIGGITVNIANEDVLYWTNQYLGESNTFGNRHDPPIEDIGEQTLTGAQALAYSRNRYSDSDYGRTERQREVVGAIFEKAKTLDMLKALNMVTQLAPYIKTSLSLSEMSSYARIILGAGDISFEDFRIPTDEYSLGGMMDGVWYLFPNTLVDNARVLHQFIYGENYVFKPTYTLERTSNRIEEYAISAGAEEMSTDFTNPEDSDIPEVEEYSPSDSESESSSESLDESSPEESEPLYPEESDENPIDPESGEEVFDVSYE